jgi:hypothetical protein
MVVRISGRSPVACSLRSSKTTGTAAQSGSQQIALRLHLHIVALSMPGPRTHSSERCQTNTQELLWRMHRTGKGFGIRQKQEARTIRLLLKVLSPQFKDRWKEVDHCHVADYTRTERIRTGWRSKPHIGKSKKGRRWGAADLRHWGSDGAPCLCGWHNPAPITMPFGGAAFGASGAANDRPGPRRMRRRVPLGRARKSDEGFCQESRGMRGLTVGAACLLKRQKGPT